MKKYALMMLSILFALVLITGCGNKNENGTNDGVLKTKTCTKTTINDDGYSTTDTMIISYKNDKVMIVEDTNISETSPQFIDMSLSIAKALTDKLNEINGFTVECSKEDSNKIKAYMKVDFDKIDINNLKEKLGDLYSEDKSFYTKKDITINDFINTNLSGYTCK